MQLVDFNKWLGQINESTDSINMTFKLDPNYLDEVKAIYSETLTDHLEKNIPYGSSYSIENTDSSRSITVSILNEDDEISAAIFGPAESFSFTLYPPYVDYIGQIMSIGPRNVTNQITNTFYNAIVDKTEDLTTIRVRSMNREDFDDKLKSIATRVVDYYTYSRNRSNITEPTDSDYNKIIHSDSKSEESIKELAGQLSTWLTYMTAIKILTKISSQLTIDLEDIRKNVLDKGLNSAIRSNDPSEQLDFFKKLISLADPRRVEESSIVTDALITIFKVLLKQYDSSLDIWRAIYKKK